MILVILNNNTTLTVKIAIYNCILLESASLALMSKEVSINGNIKD